MAITERSIVLPFSVDDSGSILSSSDQRVIWQTRVTAAVMTQIGERVFRPEYGGNIKRSLFETDVNAQNIAEASVREVFTKFLTSLVLDNVSSAIDPQEGTLSITINYTLPNQDKGQVQLTTGALTRSGDVTLEY